MAGLTEALDGIWFWEARHPDWESGDGWEPEVRSWALATPVGLVLVDPLVRDDLDGEQAWSDLDGLAGAHGSVHAVLRTLHFHHRSAAQVSARYDVPIHARPLPRDTIPVHPFDRPTMDGHELLGGLVAHHVDRDDELALWIPWASALLVADVILRTPGGIELCPESWVHEPEDRWPELRRQLTRLAGTLQPEHLLLSHGPHRTGDGPQMLAAVDAARARRLGPFINAEDLAERRTSILLADVRFAPDGDGRARHEAAHLPGAVFVDLDDDLADPIDAQAHRGRHPLPDPERFAASLAAAGISHGDTVVAYDDEGGVIAARLVWMLRVLGEDAALLTPVPDAWEASEVPPRAPGNFRARPWPTEALTDIDGVADRDPGTVLLDVRPPERFRGQPDDPDPRPGHIPGAVNLPCREHLSPDGHLLPRPILWERFRATGIDPAHGWISSCGSGVTACHTLLVAEAIGLGGGRLYPGSFSEWSRDPERPVASGG